MARMYLLIIACCVLCLHSTTVGESVLTGSPDDSDIHTNIESERIFEFPAGASFLTGPDDPDIHTNISGLITNKGYPLEEHTVTTSDGYILSIQRIPHGINSSSATGSKGAVLIIHGVVLDASQWVINMPYQSLGFVLPDAGYDVWLLNTRGTTYSRRHVKYNTRQYQFWNFSYDQLAQYDVPETIDYILEATGEEQLYVIGYSQGSAATFAMLSEKPDYNDKVKLFVAFAPVAWTGHLSSATLRVLILFKDAISLAVKLTTSGEILSNEMFKTIRVKFCSTLIGRRICEDVVALAVGRDRKQLNQTRMGVYSAHIPGGTSANSLVHFGQTTQSKQFRKYDYKLFKNLKYYQQIEPPNYDVTRITAPVALFWSKADPLADYRDVAILRRKLNNIVFDYRIPYRYNHFDFFIAMNAPQMINKPLLQLLSEY